MPSQETQKTVDQLRFAISENQEHPRTLALDQDHHTVELLKLLNSTAPVSSLPFEILSNIFILACLDHSHRHICSIPVGFILAGVNCKWRNIAITTPALWSLIQVHEWRSPEYVQLCIDRSNSLPLDIFLYGKAFMNDLNHSPSNKDHFLPSAATQAMETVARTFVKSVSRWRHLFIESHQYVFRHSGNVMARFLSHSCAPILETIDVRVRENDVRTNETILHKAYHPIVLTSPAVKSLTFGTFDLSVLSGYNISHIVNLCLIQNSRYHNTVTSRQSLTVFEKFSDKLMKLTIGGSFFNRVIPDLRNGQRIIFSSLTSIHVENIDNAHEFFNHIRAPALQDLHWRSDTENFLRWLEMSNSIFPTIKFVSPDLSRPLFRSGGKDPRSLDLIWSTLANKFENAQEVQIPAGLPDLWTAGVRVLNNDCPRLSHLKFISFLDDEISAMNATLEQLAKSRMSFLPLTIRVTPSQYSRWRTDLQALERFVDVEIYDRTVKSSP